MNTPLKWALAAVSDGIRKLGCILVLTVPVMVTGVPTCFAVAAEGEEGEGECLEEYYYLPVENDFDGDLLADVEEAALGMDETDPDEDGNETRDGLDLAYRLAGRISDRPWVYAYGMIGGEVWPADLQEQLPADQVSVVHLDYQVDCYYEDAACGLPVTIGELILFNPALHAGWEKGLSMPIIGWQYLRHGSFSYAWTTCNPGKGRLDPYAIKMTLDVGVPEGEGESFCPENLVMDPIFDSGDLELFWADSISSPGNLLCNAETCDGGAPYLGDYWVRFYSRVTDDVLAFGQEIQVPSATLAHLTYSYSASAEAFGYVGIYLSGILVDELTLPGDTTGGVYLERSVDVSAFADGAAHILEFVNPSLGGADMAFDAICLQVGGGPPQEGEGEPEEGEFFHEGEGETPGEGEVVHEGEGETPFEGEIPVEGETTAIHPADSDGDSRFIMSEAIACLAAWQHGTMPMAYAIRAAYLWQNGEYYGYDPLLPPPLCWVPTAPAEGEGEGEGEKPSLAKYYVPYENPIVPNAPTYALPIAVEEIPNYASVDTLLDISSADTLLSTNGFALLEHDWAQHIYGLETNDDIILPYQILYEAEIPIFITSDTLLHLYHVQFDESLKEVEETEFFDDIKALTDVLLQQAQSGYAAAEDNLKEASKRNVAFLSVAARVLDETADTPELVADTVNAELALIADHGGYFESPLFIYQEDYSQYVPRGHYTRSETLERYFKGLMWYGRMAFLLKGHESWGPTGEALISPYDADIQTLQAVLLARALEEVTVADGRLGREVWDRMYAVTAFYVGLADDLTPFEYMQAANTVFGADFDTAVLEEENALFELRKELAQLRMPQIYGGTGNIYLTPPITPESLNEALVKTQGMRFMGQRFIPDSYMFQHLVFPEVLDYTGSGFPFTLGETGGGLARCYPRGLDVMALMGSPRAYALLVAEGDTEYVDFDKAFSELQTEFAAFDETDWNRNLYWGWLYALRTLTRPFPEGYPAFMRTPAWEDKELQAALASWTELRHDTILYAKQSSTPGYTYIPEIPPGYVEPVPEFFGQLLALTRMTRLGLLDLDALSETAEARLLSLEEILETLIQIANKQLVGDALTEDDIQFIKDFGALLEYAVVGVAEQGVKTTLVADVHTHGNEGRVVEEGVGEVDLIVVACPTTTGDIFLAAGPALSYYEFKHPMGDRLTDEAWRALLASEAAPERPAWTDSFMP